MKKINSALLTLGLAFLAYLVWKLGPRELGKELGAVGWGLAYLVLIEGAANVIHTLGWRCCLNPKRQRVSLWRLFRINMSGWAINYLTPTASVGGEVSRAALLASSYQGPEAVSSVFLDKLMTGVAHVALVVLGAGFLFWRVSLPLGLWVAMGLTTVLLTIGMTGFLLLQKYGKVGAICRWLVQHKLGGASVELAAQQLSKVDSALKDFYRDHPRGLVWSVVWHLVGHCAALLHAWVFLRLLGQPAPLSTVVAAGLLSLWFDLLTFAVPMNLGALEGSRIVIFRALGCQALLGMAFGIAVRLAQVFWAGFGLVSYAFMTTRKPAPSSKSSSSPLTRVKLGAPASGVPHGVREHPVNEP